MGHISNNIDDQCSKQVVVNNEGVVIKRKGGGNNNNNNNDNDNDNEGIKGLVNEGKLIIQARIREEGFHSEEEAIITSSILHASMPKLGRSVNMKGCISKSRASYNYRKGGLPLVRVIQLSPPTLVTTKPEDFMSVVQQLTGSPNSSSLPDQYLHALPLPPPLSLLAVPSPSPSSPPPSPHYDHSSLLHPLSPPFDPLPLVDVPDHYPSPHLSSPFHHPHHSTSLHHPSLSYTSCDPSLELQPSISHSRFSIDSCFNDLDGLAAGSDPFEAQSSLISTHLSAAADDRDECRPHDGLFHEDCNYNRQLQYWDSATLIHDMFDEIDNEQPQLIMPQVGMSTSVVSAQLLNSYAFSAARDGHYHLIAS